MKTYVQQIMLGTVTGSEEKARQVLARIKSAGYDGLELNRFMIHPTSLFVRMLTKAAGMPTGKGGKLDWPGLLREAGLVCGSLQTDLGSLEREPEAVIADAKSLGTDRLVITGMYRFDYGNSDTVKALAERLNKVGETVKAQGISLLYHNHNAELLPLGGGRCAYDVILEETDPALVNFEFDSYWFTEAGADAKLWMHRLGKRMQLWHATDRGSRQSGPVMTPLLKSDCMELGTGSMDLDGLLATAQEYGVEDVILESHRNWIDKDPVRSLEVSARWLNGRK